MTVIVNETWENPLGPAPYPESDAWRSMLTQAKTIWDL